MDKLAKVRAEIERLKRWNDNVRDSTRHMTLQEEDFNRGKHSSYLEILNFIDSLQEEPVSIDFEQELYKAFGQVKDFTLGIRIAKWFYDMGKNSQEPVSEELEDFALQYAGHHAPYDDCMQEVEDAFKAGAKWQKNKIMEDAVDGIVAESAGGDGWVNVMTGFVKSKDVNVKFGDKIKIIVVKED